MYFKHKLAREALRPYEGQILTEKDILRIIGYKVSSRITKIRDLPVNFLGRGLGYLIDFNIHQGREQK